MVDARDRDGQISESELPSLAMLVLWAGYDSTTTLIGLGLLELLQRPEQ
jgi:cytochrome P450